jgi:hypothetical protein
MIEVFFCETADFSDGWPIRRAGRPQFLPIPAQFEGQLLLNLWLNVP